MAVAIQTIDRTIERTPRSPQTPKAAAKRQVLAAERSEGKPRSHAGLRETREATQLRGRLDETLAEAVAAADPMAWLVAHATTWPLLSARDERTLFLQLRTGTPAQAAAARERLILSNLRLVMLMAGRMQHQAGGAHVELADLTQEGVCGLMHAIDKFDTTLGNRFSTYATWWIGQYLIRAGAQCGHMIRLPQYLYDARRRAIRIRAQLVNEQGGEEPSLEAWAQACGLDPEDLSLAMAAQAPVYSLDTRLDDTGASFTHYSENGDDRTFGDLLADPGGEEQIEAIGAAEESSGAWLVEIARYALRHDRQGEKRLAVFLAHYRDGVTLEALGKRYGVTREAIRQHVERARTVITAAIVEARAADGEDVAPLLAELARVAGERRRAAKRFTGGLRVVVNRVERMR